MKPRKAYAQIEYDGVDISEAVAKGLISVTYTDNLDEADEVKITIEDTEGNWTGPWYPKVGVREN
jgi:phage protein D